MLVEYLYFSRNRWRNGRAKKMTRAGNSLPGPHEEENAAYIFSIDSDVSIALSALPLNEPVMGIVF
jgi:hypothetical protein